MWGEIIVGIITAVASLLGVYISNRKSAALISYRMEQLEKKVEKHNNVIERVYRLEAEISKESRHRGFGSGVFIHVGAFDIVIHRRN